MFYIYDKQSVICFVHLQFFAKLLQSYKRHIMLFINIQRKHLCIFAFLHDLFCAV